MNTLARIKKAGKNFEIIVDLDEALKFRKGETNSIEAQSGRIFTDSKKGFAASDSDLESAFGTTDFNEAVQRIVKEGEVQLTQEHRDAEQEKKFRQIVDFLVRNAVDPQTGNPHTAERIQNALKQAHVNIKNVPIESQISDIVHAISEIIPIKIETKKVKLTVPAAYTGKVYGTLNQYKETENWKDDGSLEVVVKVPAGLIMDFYDKLNNATHGSVLSEEIREKEE